MATPLMADGETVNTAVIPQLANFLINAGASGLFVGGTTGEGILLAADQRRRLHETAVQAANGRVPVIVHVGHNRLQTAVSLAQHAAQIQANYIAAVTPYFYKTAEDQLVDYYLAIAQAAPNTPLLLYDIPQLAVNGITAKLINRLHPLLPTLAGMKTSRPNAQEVLDLLRHRPPGFTVLIGNEQISLAMLANGADGLVSGLSTAVPEPFVALTAAFEQGDLAQAEQAQRRVWQLLGQLPGDQRLSAIKQILIDRGVPVGPPVPPRQPLGQAVWPSLEQASS